MLNLPVIVSFYCKKDCEIIVLTFAFLDKNGERDFFLDSAKKKKKKKKKKREREREREKKRKKKGKFITRPL